MTLPSRLLALAAATLAFAGIGLESSVPVAAQVAEPTEITDGYVDWGFKESWRVYMGQDSTTLSDGATWTPEGVYRFPVRHGTYDPESRTTVLELDGTVHFSKHDDLLNMTVWDLRVVISPDEQLIWGNISSRELGGDQQIIDYGMTPIAQIDVSAVDPVTSDGTTTWSAGPTSLTAEAAPRFIGYYPVGQQLDPLTIVYTGPGGKPEAEVVTPPGTPGVEVLDSIAQGFDVSVTYTDNQLSGLFYDEANDLLHLVNTGAQFLRAADAETLEPVGAPSSRRRPAAAPQPAFDPTTGQIFAVSAPSTGGSSALTASTWNPATATYVTETIDAALPGMIGATLAWDAVGERLAAYVLEPSGTTQLPIIRTWERDTGGWTRVDYPLPLPEPDEWPGFSIDSLWTWWGPSGSTGLAALPDGTFVLARSVGGSPEAPGLSSPTLRLTLTEASVHTEELDGTQVFGTQTSPGGRVPGFSHRVAVGADGTIVLVQHQRDPNKLLVLGPAGDSYVPLAEVQTEAIGRLASSTVDPVDGTVYVADTQVGNLLVVRGGRIVLRQPVAGLLNGAMSPDTPGGTVVLRDRTVVTTTIHDGVAHLTKLRVSGASPSIDEQPSDVTITVSGSSTATVEFHAAASGEPAPDLQWQVRVGGAGAWRNIDGATSETLAIEATAADAANQYRLRATNAAGRNVSEPATLSVAVPPSVLVQPEPATVDAGEPAEFLVMPAGAPTPEITWQRQVAEGWVDLSPDDPTYAIDGGFLTVVAVGPADSGAQFRARLENISGVVVSDAVTLTVDDGEGPGGASEGTQTVTATVEEDLDGEFVWEIDGSNRAVELGVASNAGGYWHATGELVPITVVDGRADGPAWSISGQLSDFTGGVSGRYLGWTPAVSGLGGAIPGDPVSSGFGTAEEQGLAVSRDLAGAPDGHPTGVTDVGADLDLRLPIDTPAGMYTATLTITAVT